MKALTINRKMGSNQEALTTSGATDVANVLSVLPRQNNKNVLSPAEIKEHLLNCACLLITQEGERTFDLGQVAEVAGLSTDQVVSCFKTEQALLQALVEVFACELQALADDAQATGRDPASRMARYNHLVMTLGLRDGARAYGLIYVVSHMPSLKQQLVEPVKKFLGEGVKKGQFTVSGSDADLDLVVGSLLYGLRACMERVDDSESYCADLTANILRALGMANQAALERVKRLLH